MPNLRFVTETGRSTSAAFQRASANFDAELLDITARVDALAGRDWIGASSGRFKNEYHEWAHTMREMIQQLDDMRKWLDQEIADWESAASAL